MPTAGAFGDVAAELESYPFTAHLWSVALMSCKSVDECPTCGDSLSRHSIGERTGCEAYIASWRAHGADR